MTTKSYLKMCDNPELRKVVLDSLKLGSVVRFYDPLSKEIHHTIIGDSIADLPERQIDGFRKSPELILLPPQEWYWGMLPLDGEYDEYRLELLYGTRYGTIRGIGAFTGDSFEEILLQMVFYTIFNKRWEDGKWVGV